MNISYFKVYIINIPHFHQHPVRQHSLLRGGDANSGSFVGGCSFCGECEDELDDECKDELDDEYEDELPFELVVLGLIPNKALNPDDFLTRCSAVH